MQIKIFTIPLFGGEEWETVFNKFLASHKVLSVEQELVSIGNTAHWTFCVRYYTEYKKSASKEKIDYKTILDEVTFDRFSKLRVIRKEAAKKEGVPPYLIFTDEQLSLVAKLKEISEKSLQTVNGFGEKKLERYGKYFINLKFDLKK